jgi:Holliday junction DNA helicase RuvA
MIGKLQGIVDHIGDDYIILMVNDVGYKVFVPDVSGIRHQVSGIRTLWIETVVREDSFRLFGFESLGQQELFNKLTSVSGVGPKVGMAILGAFNTNTLLTAIATGDAKTITAAPGVGKKVAEKIIVELKDKLGVRSEELGVGCDNSSLLTPHSSLADLLSALESLGYKRSDVVELGQKLVRENQDADVGTLVRLALKEISK